MTSLPPRPPFEAVVVAHGATVLRVCRALLAAADVDDVWSETFLAALRAYPDLPAGANVRGWLVTIAHHKAIDAHRARQRRPVPSDTLPEQSDPPVEPADDELRGRLAALPPKQRQAVAYHYLADLPYAEVAALLGGSTDAARRAAADGIKTLRQTYRVKERS